jgi:phage repressor protein C with HTH and peptisase S24 domain
VHIEEVNGGELMPSSVVRREFGVRADRIKRIRIWGDSMEPTLSNGDIVYAVMMEDEAPSDGVVYIMRSPAGLVCKRLRIDVEDGTSGEPSYFVRVVSDNPEHQDLRLTLSTFQADWRLVAYVPKATRNV